MIFIFGFLCACCDTFVHGDQIFDEFFNRRLGGEDVKVLFLFVLRPNFFLCIDFSKMSWGYYQWLAMRVLPKYKQSIHERHPNNKTMVCFWFCSCFEVVLWLTSVYHHRYLLNSPSWRPFREPQRLWRFKLSCPVNLVVWRFYSLIKCFYSMFQFCYWLISRIWVVCSVCW